MTKDDIIRMAREAGFVERNAHSDIIVRHSNGSWVSVHDLLERFAALAVAAEREACAKVAEDPQHGLSAWRARENIATAIRARGKK